MLYLLDRNVRTARWNGEPLHEASSAIVKEDLNGDFVLTVKYPITDTGIYQLIKEDMLIKAPTPVLGAQLFRIKKPIEHDDYLDITAYHLTDDIMKRSIKPMSIDRQGCFMALSQMVQNAKTDLGDFSFTSDISERHTFNTDETKTLYSVLMDGKHSIVGTWEGELVRDNLALTVKKNRGADRGVIITTHQNLTSYERTKDSHGVVTRIHARSTFRPEGAESSDDEVTISVTVDSPLIGNYPYINEKEYQNNDLKTQEELRKWAEAKFTHEGIDKVLDAIKIEAHEIDGQTVHMGDTVTIKSRKHAVDLQKKAVAYEFDCLANDGKGEYLSITFDDSPGFGSSSPSNGLSSAVDAILGVGASAQEISLQRAIDNANQAFDAEFAKNRQAIEDGIEQAKAEAEVFATGVAQQVSQDLVSVKDKLDGLDQLTKILEESNQESAQKAQDALDEAGAVKDLAQEAKRVSEEAKQVAQSAVQTATQSANQLQADLDTTKRTIEDQAKDILAQAQAQVETNRRMTTVEDTANGTKSTVAELTKTVNAATGNLDGVTKRVSSVETSLSGVREQYSQISQNLNDKTEQITSLTQQTADLKRGLTGVEERFDNIQVGGVNLLRNSSFAKNMQDWVVSGTFEKSEEPFEHHRVTGELRQSKYIRQSIFEQIKDDPDDQIYTFSLDVKVDNIVAGTRDPFLRIYFDGTRNSQWYGVTYLPGAQIDIGNYNNRGWQRLTGQIRFPSRVGMTSSWASLYFRDFTGSVSFRKFKLERGTIPTDYSSAEEDFRHEFAEYKRTATENSAELGRKIQSLDGTLSDTKTLAQQTADSIEQLATKVNVDQDGRITRAESSIRHNSEEIDKRLTRAEVDSLVDDRGLVSATVFDNYKRETAQSIERGLTETRALIPTEVGGENLLKNSLFAKTSQAPERFTVTDVTYVNKYAESWSNFYNSGISNPATSYHAYLNETFISGTPVVEFNESDGTRQWKGINQRIAPGKLIGRDYHFSADIYVTGSGTKFWFGFYYYKKSGQRDFHMGTTTVVPTAINQWQRLGGVIKFGEDVDASREILFFVYSYGFKSNAILYLKRPKLERGKIGTDHSLALEDMVTEVDFNKVRETSRLYERIVGSTEDDVATKISRMAMASELFRTEVGKALASSENLVYDPTRYSKYQPRNATSRPVLASYAMYSAMRISHSGLTADQFNGFRLPLRTSTFTAGEKLSLRAVIGVDVLPDSGGHIKFEIKNQGAIIAYFWLNPTRVGNNQVFTATTTVQVSTASVDDYGLDILINRNGNVNITQISLVRGDTPPKSFVDNTSSQEVNLTTKMTQMSDSWAVRTLNNRGDVLSQINLAAGATSIEVGKNKLVITPETTYFQNGTIKSAMIESLHASKLVAETITSDKLASNSVTSGKIQAGSVQTLHLQAQAVTGDKILFDKAFFDNMTANTVVSGTTTTKKLFSTIVQSVEISADKINGGKLTALNGSMEIDLNNAGINFNRNANIVFNSSNNTLYRNRGTNTAFLHFVDESRGGVYAGLGVTSSGDGVNSQSAGRFAGIRIFRTAVGGTYSTRHEADIDQVEIYGDKVLISDDFKISRGFRFNPEFTNGIVDVNVWLRSLRQFWASLKQIDYNLANLDFRRTVDNLLNQTTGL